MEQLKSSDLQRKPGRYLEDVQVYRASYEIVRNGRPAALLVPVDQPQLIGYDKTLDTRYEQASDTWLEAQRHRNTAPADEMDEACQAAVAAKWDVIGVLLEIYDAFPWPAALRTAMYRRISEMAGEDPVVVVLAEVVDGELRELARKEASSLMRADYPDYPSRRPPGIYVQQLVTTADGRVIHQTRYHIPDLRRPATPTERPTS